MNPNLQLGVAPLSAIEMPPHEFIRAAHAAGFAAVGLRAMSVSPTDAAFPLDLTSSDFAQIRSALADTGTEVLDIEVLSVTPERRRDEWLPVLDAGRALGASYVNIVCDDPVLARFTATTAAITADAHERGIEPVLEPVAFRPLNSFDRAFAIAREIGCRVELDVLHYLRTGADLDLIEANADLLPILQLCDAPATRAEHESALRALAADDSDQALDIAEARALRLLPGAGGAPIRELLTRLGADVRISVEIPNTPLRAGRDGAAYLALLHEASAEYLSQVSAA